MTQRVGDWWYKLLFTFTRVLWNLSCCDSIMLSIELCPPVGKAIDVTQIQALREWMSHLFLHHLPGTVVADLSASWRLPLTDFSRWNSRDVQFPWQKRWDVLLFSPLLLLPLFLIPTFLFSLWPFIPNALLIFYHVLVTAIGIDAMKKKIQVQPFRKKHLAQSLSLIHISEPTRH